MESQSRSSRVNSDPRNHNDPDHTPLGELDTQQVPARGISVKSTNPFRKHEVVLSFDIPRNPSPEPSNSIGVRKNTPVRAVFDDLTTAHSSITSRSARSGHRKISHGDSDPANEENSIPLETLPPPNKDQRYAVLQDLPLPPSPAVLPTTRFARTQDYLSGGDERLAGQGTGLAEPIQPSLPAQNQAVFASVKSALVSLSSPSKGAWPRDRQSSENDQDLRSLENRDNGQDAEYAEDFSNYHPRAGNFKFPPGTPDDMRKSNLRTKSNGYHMSYQSHNLPSSSPMIPMSTHPHNPRLVSGSTEVSMREGSTVGNIVQHYAGSNGLDGEGTDFDQDQDTRNSQARSRNMFAPRALGHNLASSPPTYQAPRPSALQIRQQRQGRVPSTPYTRRPYPDIARDRDGNQLLDESVSDNANSTLGSLPRISHRNPYKSNQARGSQARADPDHCVYEDAPNQGYDAERRLPLEREVSQALRRASGYSAYSVGSADSSVLDYGAMLDHGNNEGFKVDRTGHLKGKGKEVARDAKNIGGGHIVEEEAKGFYDKEAIPSNWIDSRQGIRVPINHVGYFPESPPESPIDGKPQQSGQQRSSSPAADVNDWETVGESAFGLEYGNEDGTGLIGGAVHRTGSSIANTSDEGTASLHFEDLNEFGSTERIAQHPGTIQYSGDYRRRDLKATKMPILMPVFNGHKVNGYLADSNRIRPVPAQPFFRPEPLIDAHKHPFNSTPPEVRPPARVARAKGNLRSHLSPNDPGAAHSGQYNTRKDKASTYREPSFAGQSSRQASEWTDSYRQTGPSVSTQIHPFVEDDNDRPSSWAHIITFAKGGQVPGYNRDGSRICDPRSTKDEFYFRELLDEEQSVNNLGHASGQGGDYRSGRGLPSSSRQAPGAFYQGLRAVSDQRRPSHPSQHDGAVKSAGRRSTAKSNGKTPLRPFSLLNGHLPSTPLRNVSNQSDMLDSNDFVYHSPLAPPKRSTWQMLYSDSRLLEFQQKAQADGVYSTNSRLSDSNEGLSRRHLYEPPRLTPRRRKVNNDARAKAWKVKFSKTILVLCCFFPPLLILFALGKMDGLILWWSEGRFQRFGKAQKKWAGILLCTEVFIIAVLLISFLAWFFGKRRA